MGTASKVILIIGFLALAGCNTLPKVPDLHEVCQTVYLPIISVPEVPPVSPPDTPLDDATPAQLASDGELAKRYVAQVKSIEDYAHALEQQIAAINVAHEESVQIQQQVEAKGFKPMQLPPDITPPKKPFIKLPFTKPAVIPTTPVTVPVPGPNGTTIPCDPGKLCGVTPVTPKANPEVVLPK